MVRGFEILSLGLLLLFPLASNLAQAAETSPEICKPHDDKAEALVVDSYFESNLREHLRFSFSKPIAAKVRSRARSFFDQRVSDKRAEICAERLKLAEDIKLAPAKFTSGDCAAAAVVELLDRYMTKVAGTYDENLKILGSLRDEQVRDLKLKLFEIAKGSTAGVEGVPLAGMSKEAKIEWVKAEASRLGGEAQLVWGASSPEKNPLIQKILPIAREAVRARAERDQTKIRLHTDGKIAPTCKLK